MGPNDYKNPPAFFCDHTPTAITVIPTNGGTEFDAYAAGWSDPSVKAPPRRGTP